MKLYLRSRQKYNALCKLSAMKSSALQSLIRNENQQLRLPFRLVWNSGEHRPRALVRFVTGSVLIFLFAALGSQYRRSPLAGEGPVIQAINQLVWVLPQAVSISVGVVLAALLIDRRRLTNLGLDVDLGWWRGLAGGTGLGVGITVLSVVVGLVTGYYDIVDVQIRGGLVVWPLFAVGAAGFQLLYLVPEELFIRAYMITNIIEGFDGVSSVPRSVAAGIGVVVTSVVFYFTHSGRGHVFGVMIGGIAVLLGIGYVLSGDLSVPIGMHFGFNIAGVFSGTNPQPASLLQLTATGSIEATTLLPIEAVAVQLVGTALGVGLLFWWYHTNDGRVQVDPAVARPTLRWNRSGDMTNEKP